MGKEKVLIALNNVGFSKNGTTCFENIEWEICEKENWAIIGPNGAGKTLLAEAIIGNIFIYEGTIDYNFRKSSNGYLKISDFISYISFAENSGLFSYANHYYQQRFNATESDDSITVRSFLGNIQGEEELLALFEIEELLDREFIKLSNGQTRKVRLVKALLKKPQLLILDDPLIGLDVESRKNILNIINQLSAQGTNILLITTKKEIPECITHVLELKNCRIKFSGTKKDFDHRTSEKEAVVDDDLLKGFFNTPKNSLMDFNIAVRFSDVNIKYGENHVIRNLSWEIKKGEKWALSGPNGAGKSTLLSLINADNPQAYSQDILLFDKQRGSGESIWDIKKRIGYLSPELHLYFRSDMNCKEVAATGFVDTLFLNRSLKSSEEEVLSALFEYFNIADFKEKTFLRISVGQQRLILFIRALVKNPPVLILDEPFQGMAEEIIEKCQKLLKLFSRPSKTIIFVTHEKGEIPEFIDKTFFLKEGKGTIIK